MNNAQLRYVFDRLKEADNSTRTGLLQIEVRLSGTNKRKLISTGIRLYANQVSNKNGFTCKGHLNAVAITGKARRLFLEIEGYVLSERCKSLEDVKFWKDPVGIPKVSVIGFMREELRKSDPSDAKIEHHNSLFKRIEEFGEFKSFSDVTYGNLCDFDAYLRVFINSGATLYKRHSAFRSYIDKAIYKGLCERNPYVEFKMPAKKSKEPVFLTESDMQRIIDYKPITDKMEHIKDLFIFQMYTGLAYVDLANFSRESITEIEGVLVLANQRIKTGIDYISVFLNEARDIAEKYDYKLPVISNQKYNDFLKVLAVSAGITKNLTTHVGRHTFATYLLNKDISLKTVSKAMGHSSVKMTEHYAKLLGKTVVNDMKKLLG